MEDVLPQAFQYGLNMDKHVKGMLSMGRQGDTWGSTGIRTRCVFGGQPRDLGFNFSHNAFGVSAGAWSTYEVA